jgi:predicted aspartyl protease
MGITYVPGTLVGPTGETDRLDFLVDSGATYTVVPESSWRKLGLRAIRTQRFRFADGSPMERNIGRCEIQLELGDAVTPVILGLPGDEALLGAVTLEELGLVLDPFSRTLHPANALMA